MSNFADLNMLFDEILKSDLFDSDYYEMQLEEVGIKYPILKQSFNYYLGLSEIAINLLNYLIMQFL